MPYSEMDNTTLAILPSYPNGLERNPKIPKGMLRQLQQGLSKWHGWCIYTLSSDERVLLKSRMREIFMSGSARGVKFFYKAEYCDTLQSKEKRNREYEACLNERAILHLLDQDVT